MSSRLNELYRLEKQDVDTAGSVLATAFFEDPAWIKVLPDPSERRVKLPLCFQFILTYAIKYGEVYAPSSNLEGIALWLPYDLIEITVWRMLRSGAFRRGLKMGQDLGNRIQQVFNSIDSDRKENMADRAYIYLQAIGVAPEFQGKGFGGTLLRSMFERCDKEGMAIYLETETPENVEMYKKMGFTVLKERMITEYDFVMWEMIREPK